MVTIHLSPVCSYGPVLVVYWNDPVITVTGIDYDLSELQDGSVAIHPVLGVVSRFGSNYELTLRLPHRHNAPITTRFPSDITVVENGPVNIPSWG